MPTRQQQQAQAQRQRRAAGAAAAAGATAAAVGAGAAFTPAAVAAAGAAGATVAAAGILSTFVSFLSTLGEQHRQALSIELGRHTTQLGDIADVVRQEMVYEREFAQRSAARLASALPQALAIADPAQREGRIRQLLSDEERYARMRGEAMFARAIAALTRSDLRQSSPLGAFWRLGPAQKHTEGCLHMSGHDRGLAGRFWPWAVLDRVHPPRHYGCLVGWTSVWGPAVRSTTDRWYEGEILRITFTSGHEIGITPNHPILQRCGWVSADALRIGDQVVCCSAEELRMRVGDPDEVQMPAAIEQVARALADAVPVQASRVPVSAEDFHGDGRKGHVDVVRAGGLLDDWLVTADVQQLGEATLRSRDRATALLASDSAAGEGVVAVRFAAFGVVRWLSACEALLGGQLRVAHPGGFASIASYASGAHPAVDSRPGDSEAGRELLAGFSGEVATDEIVSIERHAYRGHVYNLETVEGWYSAGGIVVHNCTSALHGYSEAVLAGWMGPGDVPDARQAVRDAAGVVMEQADADAILAELDVRDQLSEMGIDTTAIPFAGVAEAFDEGKHPRGYHGRFRKVADVAAALKRGEEASIEAADAPKLVDALADGTRSSLHLLEVRGHPNLFRAHARELPRAQMPQIPKEHLPGFMDFLRSKRIGATVEEVSPSSLQATQNQVNGAAVAALAKGWDPKRGGVIMVSREGHVLDGHHRWGAAALHELANPDYKMNTLRFGAGTDRILALMHEYNRKVGVTARAFGEGRVAGRGA